MRIFYRIYFCIVYYLLLNIDTDTFYYVVIPPTQLRPKSGQMAQYAVGS